jgi:hypothetical protein
MLQDTNGLPEAEPLMRRALAIDEASFGAEHPDVARDLNSLAQLKATNRLPDHPKFPATTRSGSPSICCGRFRT